jgi:hypothetical protein
MDCQAVEYLDKQVFKWVAMVVWNSLESRMMGKKKNTLGSAAPDGRHMWVILCCARERFLLFNCNEV